MAFDTMHDGNDDALMVLFANGDQTAARLLTNRHAPLVFARAYRLLQNEAEAEEVAQEAMLRLWRMAPDWRQGKAKVSTWLFKVVTNLCTDILRKRRPAASDELQDIPDENTDVREQLVEGDRKKGLRMALDRLPERQRVAIVLRHLEEISNVEIAEQMEISVEAVESLVARGKRTLATDLKKNRDKWGLA